MGRHEIRLRRKAMTSRRIERHKNYAGLLDQHRRLKRTRSIVRWAVFILIFLMSLMVVYLAVDSTSNETNEKTPVEVQDNNK